MKTYEAHEDIYRRMRAQGIRSWDLRASGGQDPHEIEANTERFLSDALDQPWAPRGGQAIDLGCGTGPVLRWLARRGFGGVGVDISETAIAMAREQSEGLSLRFRQGDVCSLEMDDTVDLAVDGHCLHCLTDPGDRRRFLSGAYRLLRPGGLLLVSSMCGPVDRARFPAAYAGQKLYRRVIYVPSERAAEYADARVFGGRAYLPTRYLGHWQGILREIRDAGLRIRLLRHAPPSEEECVGALDVAATRPA